MLKNKSEFKNKTYILKGILKSENINKDDYMERFTKDLAKASVCVELVISRTDEVHEDVEIKSIAYPEFLTLVAEAKENHYLEEKIWKKIDELVENINLTEKFGFGNKNILQLERLTSTPIK